MAQQVITPEQQIANVKRVLAAHRASKRYRGRAEAIRTTERQLAEMEAKYEAGQLQAIIVTEDCPF